MFKSTTIFRHSFVGSPCRAAIAGFLTTRPNCEGNIETVYSLHQFKFATVTYDAVEGTQYVFRGYRNRDFSESEIGNLQIFCEQDSGIDNTRIRELMVGNRGTNVAGIRESGDLLGILFDLQHMLKMPKIISFLLCRIL